jgi:uncharacterized membrane protein
VNFRIKIPNSLIIIDILTLFLILAITFIPSSAVRIVLGLPFLLFFPGYTLVAALFSKKEGMDFLERLALSFGMSIAVTALIGLGLNYTPWGIRLQPVIYSISIFIILMSIIALVRNNFRQSIREIKVIIPRWEGSRLNKSLTVVLIIFIFCALAVLGYTVAKPQTGEKFTEFYILGNAGKAENYPTQFTLTQDKVTGVSYDGGMTLVTDGLGKIKMGIVNHEQQPVTYRTAILIDGQSIDIEYADKNLEQLDGIALRQGEKWEEEIGFAPLHPGKNQKVEFLLYKNGNSAPEDSLNLWINVQ